MWNENNFHWNKIISFSNVHKTCAALIDSTHEALGDKVQINKCMIGDAIFTQLLII